VVIVALVVAAARAPSTNDLVARVSVFGRAHHSLPVSLSAIAPSAREAVVATEDERFYQHGGVEAGATGASESEADVVPDDRCSRGHRDDQSDVEFAGGRS
jgi:hypothetical protein